VKTAAVFDAIMAAPPAPCPADQVEGVFALWRGQAYPRASTEAAYRKLYSTAIVGAGTTWSKPIHTGKKFTDGTWDREQRVDGVTVDDATMNGFLEMMHGLPQTHVRSAPIIFAAMIGVWNRKTLNPDGTAGPNTWSLGTADPGTTNPTALDTSYWWDSNKIVMRAVGNAAGGFGGDNTPVAHAGDVKGPDGKRVITGDGRPLAVDTDEQARRMTIFQNHARHEIGHSVGARQLTIGSGNDKATTWASWAPSTAAALQTAYWPAGPNLNFNIAALGGAVSYNDADVRAYLGSIVQTGSPDGGSVIGIDASASDGDTKMIQRISAARPAAVLPKYALEIWMRGLPNAYIFDNIAPAGTVHMRSTRTNAEYMQYSAEAQAELKTQWGWYSLSSPAECFAEIYTKKYSGGLTPRALNGVDWAAFFTALEAIPDQVFQAAPIVGLQNGVGAEGDGTGGAGAATETAEGTGGGAPNPLPLGAPFGG
jgi:hypothetical protein